jgi:hypothetical protein
MIAHGLCPSYLCFALYRYLCGTSRIAVHKPSPNASSAVAIGQRNRAPQEQAVVYYQQTGFVAGKTNRHGLAICNSDQL